MQKNRKLSLALSRISGSHHSGLIRIFLQKERRRFQKNKLRVIFDRIITLLKIFLIPFQIRFSRNINTKQNAIICFSENFQLRQKYINRYKNWDMQDFELIEISGNSPICLKSLADLKTLLSHYLSALFTGLMLFSDLSNISTRSIPDAIKIYLRSLVCGNVKRLFVFFTYLPEVYFSSLRLANEGKTIEHMITNMVYYYDRYAIFSNNHQLRFTSEAFYLEYKYYAEKGWIKTETDDCEITNNEFLLSSDDFTNTEAIEIGYFSSGEWARINGTHRTEDVTAIGNGQFLQNDRYLLVREIIQSLAELAEAKHFRLKVYLHPYEKRLIKEHHIKLPFLDLIEKKKYVSYDLSEGNSNIFEAKIGVVLSSAIFFDRWNEKLKTFCFKSDDLKSFFIPVRYMKKYVQYGYENIEELKNKIMTELAGNGTQ